MRRAVLLLALACAGCAKNAPETAPEVKVWDVLSAYSKNPAAADRDYKGKHLKLYVPGITVRRRTEVVDRPDLVIDREESVALHEPNYVDPQRFAVFRFESRDEVAALKPRVTYVITGRCEGLSGNVVEFQRCKAVEWKAPAK